MGSEFPHDADNPQWMIDDFRAARPIDEMHETEIVRQLIRTKGRPPVDPAFHKRATSIRLDHDIISHFKADGPGWQTRLNEFLLGSIRNAGKQAEGVLGQAMETQRKFATNKEVPTNA